MSADEKQASEIGRSEQGHATNADDVAQKSHGDVTPPRRPELSGRKPLFRS